MKNNAALFVRKGLLLLGDIRKVVELRTSSKSICLVAAPILLLT